MDDFDTPNFRAGYCPECGQTTGWLAIKNVWQCDFCNWEGRKPDPQTYFELQSKESIGEALRDGVTR